MKIDLTEDIMRKNIVDKYDTNMLVEAGAGAGKTTLIIERVLKQLEEGYIKAGELVIITFTKAAAEELRERLLKRLHDRVNELKKSGNTLENTKYKENVEEAIRNQGQIQISTIHSFCKTMLTEQAFAAEVPVDLEVLEGEDTKDVKTLFFDKWLRSQPKEYIKELDKEFYTGNVTSWIKDTFIHICELPAAVNFHYHEELLDTDSAMKLDDYLQFMIAKSGEFFDILVQALNEHIGNNTEACIKKMAAAVKKDPVKNAGIIKYAEDGIEIKINSLSDLYNNDDVYINSILKNVSESAKIYDTVRDLKYFSKKNKKDIIKMYKGIVTAIAEEKIIKACAFLSLAKPVPTEMTSEIVGKMSDVSNDIVDILEKYQNAIILNQAIDARDAYREAMREIRFNRLSVSQDMVLQEAMDLVAEEGSTSRKFFQDKYKCIYVDEFQDTDYVQRELVFNMCSENGNFGDDDYIPKKGSFFVVGDPKQSIYAFRGADLSVYLDTKSKFISDEVKNVEVYELTNNYRTEKSVIDWVNREFSTKLGSSVGYNPMTPVNDNKSVVTHLDEDADETKAEIVYDKVLSGVYSIGNVDGAIEKVIPEAVFNDCIPEVIKKASTNADKAINIEGIYLAKLIKYLVEAGYEIYAKDNNKVGKRKIKYSDFLILTHKKDDINILSAYLKRENIDVKIFGALDLKKDVTIFRFKSIFHYLANPYDKDAKYAAAQILIRGRITDDNEKEAYERAEALYKYTRNFDAARLVQYLVHHPEYIMEENTSGVDVSAMQSRLQQLLEYLLTKDVSVRAEYDAYIDEFIKSDVDKELVIEKDANAVKFMNLHKAKGLEGNIVIVAARREPFEYTRREYQEIIDYYPAAIYEAPYSNNPNKETTTNYIPCFSEDEAPDIAARNKEEQERRRLEYVEVTRAKEAVIFLDPISDKSIYNDYDFSETYNLSELDREVEKIVTFADYISIDKEDEDGDTVETEKENAEIKELDTTRWEGESIREQAISTFYKISPSQLELSGSEGIKGDSSGRPMGDVFGTVMHRAFELAVYYIRANKESLAKKDISEYKNIVPISNMVNQALIEEYDKVVAEIKKTTDKRVTTKKFVDYMTYQLAKYVTSDKIVSRMLTAKDVYAEYVINQNTGFKDIEVLGDDFKTVLDAAISKHLMEKGARKDITEPDKTKELWINGKADLIFVMEDDAGIKIEIVDYKTDNIAASEVGKLTSELVKKYDNQQKLYEYALSKAFGVDIERVSHEYYHMYE